MRWLLLKILPDTKICKKFEELIGGSVIFNSLRDYNAHIIIGYCLFIIFIRYFGRKIQDTASKERLFGKPELLNLVDVIDAVVEDKRSRFQNVANIVLKGDEINAENIFKTITKPERQILTIVNAISGLFTSLSYDKAKFRVGLIEVNWNNNQYELKEWFAFAPKTSPPKIHIKELNENNSTAAIALKNKNMIIVEDIQKEIKRQKKRCINKLFKNKKKIRFYKGNFQHTDNGSILAKPIYCPIERKPIFVLTVIGDEKKCLQENNKKIYSWILGHFTKRILLEYHLLKLKEVTNAH